MAVGDVWTFELSMRRKEIALRPGRYLVLVKGWFQQQHPPNTDYATFGFCQLFLGYGKLLRKVDEAVAYLGSLGWADPTDLTTIEGSRGGAVVLEAVVEVETQPGPHPEPGRLVFQAGSIYADLHDARMVVMEIGKMKEPIAFKFGVPLSKVQGLDDPAAVLEGIARLVGGGSHKGRPAKG